MIWNGDVADEIFDGFTLADEPMPVAVDEHFGRLQASVVLVAHGVAIGTRVFDNDNVAERNAFGQHALFHPEVRVFADLSAEADGLARFVLTSVDIDMVIGAVHGGAGERV